MDIYGPKPRPHAQVKKCFFSGFTWTGHFIEAFSVGGRGIKWPVQVKMCFFSGFTWTGHFIEAFSVGGGGIKWPVQVKMCFFSGFTWTGDFIEAFGILCWGRGYKVASPGKNVFFSAVLPGLATL